MVSRGAARDQNKNSSIFKRLCFEILTFVPKDSSILQHLTPRRRFSCVHTILNEGLVLQEVYRHQHFLLFFRALFVQIRR